MVTGSVKKAAGFNINSLSPIQHAGTCTAPALFITAENDDFISPSHAEQLYEVRQHAPALNPDPPCNSAATPLRPSASKR